MSLRWEDSWHKKVHGISQERMLQDRGALPKEEGDVGRECEAMHGESFLSGWLREDGDDKKERQMEVDRETEEEVSKQRK